MNEAVEYQGWDEWATKFKPKSNHFGSDENHLLYETYGEEVAYIQSMHPNFVWTSVQGEMSDLIVAGYSYVNRLGYYITENPWSNENDWCLLSVEVECKCLTEIDDTDTANPECDQCEGYGLITNYVGEDN